MRKRQRKKNSRNRCPKCNSYDGIWRWNKVVTGKWVSEFFWCFSCDFQDDEFKAVIKERNEREDER